MLLERRLTQMRVVQRMLVGTGELGATWAHVEGISRPLDVRRHVSSSMGRMDGRLSVRDTPGFGAFHITEPHWTFLLSTTPGTLSARKTMALWMPPAPLIEGSGSTAPHIARTFHFRIPISRCTVLPTGSFVLTGPLHFQTNNPRYSSVMRLVNLTLGERRGVVKCRLAT